MSSSAHGETRSRASRFLWRCRPPHLQRRLCAERAAAGRWRVPARQPATRLGRGVRVWFSVRFLAGRAATAPPYTAGALDREEAGGARQGQAVCVAALEVAGEGNGGHGDGDEDVDHVDVELDDLVGPARPQHGDKEQVDEAERHHRLAEGEEDDPVEQLGQRTDGTRGSQEEGGLASQER